MADIFSFETVGSPISIITFVTSLAEPTILTLRHAAPAMPDLPGILTVSIPREIKHYYSLTEEHVFTSA